MNKRDQMILRSRRGKKLILQQYVLKTRRPTLIDRLKQALKLSKAR